MRSRSQQFQMLANGECQKTASIDSEVFVDSLLLTDCQEVAAIVVANDNVEETESRKSDL